MPALVVDNGLVNALIPIAVVMVVGLFTWIVRELGRISIALSRVEQRMTAAEEKLEHL